MRKRVLDFLFAPDTGEPIACLRLVLGVTMMVEWAQIFPCLGELYGPQGFLQANLMDHVSGKTPASYALWLLPLHLSYVHVLSAIYWGRWVALLAFTAGVGTRAATVTLWILQAFFMCSGEFSSYGVDRYFFLLLFMMVWMKTDGAYTLTRWLRPRPPETASWQARFHLRCLQVAVLLTYLDAGISKAAGVQWWSGDAIWRVLHLPEFHRADFLWMAAVPFVPKALAWATMFFESFYFLGVWWPGIGLFWALTIIAMHLGIAAFLGLVDFGITMALINFALFVFPRTGARIFAVAKQEG